jgi:hypothetical protein
MTVPTPAIVHDNVLYHSLPGLASQQHVLGAFVRDAAFRASEATTLVNTCRLPVPNPVTFLLSDENLSQWRGGRRPKPAFKSKLRKNEMEQSVEEIIERNLLEVFNARDAGSRRAVIDERMASFIDPGGVHEGVEKINAIVQLLVRRLNRRGVVNEKVIRK